MMEIVLFPLPTSIVKIGDDVSELLISSAEKNGQPNDYCEVRNIRS